MPGGPRRSRRLWIWNCRRRGDWYHFAAAGSKRGLGIDRTLSNFALSAALHGNSGLMRHRLPVFNAGDRVGGSRQLHASSELRRADRSDRGRLCSEMRGAQETDWDIPSDPAPGGWRSPSDLRLFKRIGGPRSSFPLTPARNSVLVSSCLFVARTCGHRRQVLPVLAVRREPTCLCSSLRSWRSPARLPLRFLRSSMPRTRCLKAGSLLRN